MGRKLTWGGLFIGSAVGGYIPALWGGDMLSLSAVLFSFLGGIAGIFLGYRIGQSM